MSRPPAKCGTDSGYTRHVKRGEPACPACRQAHTDAKREYERRRGRPARKQSVSQLLPDPPRGHGRRGRYTSGCRCPWCSRANTVYEAQRRAAKRAAQ